MPNLFIVADGMGGHKAGDYASRYTVETIEREIKASFEKNPSIIIQKAIRTANKEIRQRASEDPNLYGMGTTVVVATVIGRYLQVANVGDSRLYIANGQEIRQITRDHSLVEEMVRLGGIKREEARLHPDKNIITRAIGAKDDVDIDFFTVELRPSDRILMCSDGLTNMVEYHYKSCRSSRQSSSGFLSGEFRTAGLHIALYGRIDKHGRGSGYPEGSERASG